MQEMHRAQETGVDLPTGARVHILNPFVPSWSPGFVIHDVVRGGYLVRREIDGRVLPRVFARDEVRRAGRAPVSWW